MNNIYKYTLLIFICLSLFSCGSPKVKINHYDLLVQNIVDGNKTLVQQSLQNVSVSTNVRNLILQYFDVLENNDFKLVQDLTATNEIEKQESLEFNQINHAINIWAFMQQVYRIEVAKDVRILQRENLYLAPSEVDFNKCQTSNNKECALNSRTQLYKFINQEQIIELLKQMAEKDPCINLTNELQDESKANQCLQKRMGEIDVVLVSKPKFSYQQWKNAIQ